MPKIELEPKDSNIGKEAFKADICIFSSFQAQKHLFHWKLILIIAQKFTIYCCSSFLYSLTEDYNIDMFIERLYIYRQSL